MASIPDINGEFYQINLTERENAYVKSFKSDYRVDFYVLTRHYSVKDKRLIVGDTYSLESSYFNPKNPTRIIVHGWRANKNSFINQVLSIAYLRKGEYNVIVVDWSDAVNTYDYFAARKRIGQAGKKLAKLIDFLSEYGNTDPSTVYLIGHSLGVHMCAIAARNVRSGRVGVIISLDAALPLFASNDQDRISSSDAKYVLSIHTNGGKLGIHEPVGHASFYPNWGKRQPGCGADPLSSCSHRRSVEYFSESLTNYQNNFVSRKCSSFHEVLSKRCWNGGEIAYMGGDPLNFDYKGVYYLKTNSRQPFSTGAIP